MNGVNTVTTANEVGKGCKTRKHAPPGRKNQTQILREMSLKAVIAGGAGGREGYQYVRACGSKWRIRVRVITTQEARSWSCIGGPLSGSLFRFGWESMTQVCAMRGVCGGC
eukprot:Tamp_29157.p3 GENE.Tamp_29157~~Tamp_29157.p3  ORF type:complete len:111 (+),score=5.64 Tamp_29157:172-504(+)